MGIATVSLCDGRPAYGVGGLDGLGGRMGGQETTSGDWTDQTDGNHNLAKVRVAGSNPVVRSIVTPGQGMFLKSVECEFRLIRATPIKPLRNSAECATSVHACQCDFGRWVTVLGRDSGSWATVTPVAA